jgi:adenylate cyclase
MGRSFYLRGIDKHGLRIAREMFAKAVEIDPRYARAYAALAICESYLAMGDPHATYQSFLANSRRALELDPHLAEAYTLKGLALYAEELYSDAAAEFERALRLDPDLYETHFFMRGTAAFRVCTSKRRLYSSGQRPCGQTNIARSDFWPNPIKSWAGSRNSRPPRASAWSGSRRRSRHIRTMQAPWPSAVRSWPKQASGREPRTGVARAIMIGPDDYVVRYNAARAYGLLGELGTAFDWLERSFDSSAVWQRRLALWMKSDNDIDALRGHPRFHALVQRLRAVLEPAAGCGA